MKYTCVGHHSRENGFAWRNAYNLTHQTSKNNSDDRAPSSLMRAFHTTSVCDTTMANTPNLKLSICLATFNRANFLAITLDSILSQLNSDCEIVISDNASTDNTEEIVTKYASQCNRLRYMKQETNLGFDRNFDFMVEVARGEYCWLFADDDLMKPGAVLTVLKALRTDYGLVLVNGEVRDANMANIRLDSFFGVDCDRVYASNEMDRLFTDVGACAVCICSIVIKRSFWLGRERQRFYGSWLIHVGVIFQTSVPGNTLVMAEPLVSLRLDNKRTWATERFQIEMINWPSLVWSSPLSAATKRRFSLAEPWRRLRYLLALRAMGVYSLAEYHKSVRPRLRSVRESAIPIMILFLTPKLARYFYALYSFMSGAPKSPYDARSTMFPKCAKQLRDAPARDN